MLPKVYKRCNFFWPTSCSGEGGLSMVSQRRSFRTMLWKMPIFVRKLLP
jgi:hypothetical protein